MLPTHIPHPTDRGGNGPPQQIERDTFRGKNASPPNEVHPDPFPNCRRNQLLQPWPIPGHVERSAFDHSPPIRSVTHGAIAHGVLRKRHRLTYHRSGLLSSFTLHPSSFPLPSFVLFSSFILHPFPLPRRPLPLPDRPRRSPLPRIRPRRTALPILNSSFFLHPFPLHPPSHPARHQTRHHRHCPPEKQRHQPQHQHQCTHHFHLSDPSDPSDSPSDL